MHFCIAIDGPAGVGKSTVAKLLARRLGYLYVDTGAMYRAVTLKALRQGVNLGDENVLSSLATSTAIDLITDPARSTCVFLDGKDVTSAIRTPEVSQGVSFVARVPGVRTEMARRQKQMALFGDVVMEGRDIGTVVAPEAQVKIFLTASEEERARRRQADLAEKGFYVSLEDMIKEIRERDQLDTSRFAAPLIPAIDARVVDCSLINEKQVVNLILEVIRRKKE